MYTRPTNLTWLRAGLSLTVAAVLLIGVTFAALRSQNNILQGSHMLSASANLYLSKQAGDGFSNTIPGFDFFDIVPGGAPGPLYGNNLYIRNGGSTNLELGVSLDPSRMTMINGASALHTHLLIMDSTGNTQLAKYSLSELMNAYHSATPLPINLWAGSQTVQQVMLRMQIDDTGADTSQQQEIENMDLVFSGVAA